MGRVQALLRCGLVCAVALLAGAVASCDQLLPSAQDPLPQEFAQNNIGLPTGDDFQIERVVAFTTERIDGAEPQVHIEVAYTAARDGVTPPTAAAVFYFTRFASLEGAANDYASVPGLVAGWIDLLAVLRSVGGDVSTPGSSGKSRDGNVAGAMFLVAATGQPPASGTATFEAVVTPDYFPPLCDLQPRHVAVVLAGANSQAKSNVTWFHIPRPADCPAESAGGG